MNDAAPHVVSAARNPLLSLSSVVKRYGTVLAVAGVDLSVRDGEILTILGPSGSGKTTLLKMVAGFEQPDEGRVRLGERDITDATPASRGIGMVFQNYALFPHMPVAENVAFPLEMRRVGQSQIKERVTRALALVGLAGYEKRYPRQLSGGQQQRVALARAVVFEPPLLLLDEPFGALDRKLREQMQLEVKRLQRQLGITALFVTHDQEEALVLSDRIAVMNLGRIEQIGTPFEIYAQPVNRFVADFIGESNLYRGNVSASGARQDDGGDRRRVDGRGADGSAASGGIDGRHPGASRGPACAWRRRDRGQRGDRLGHGSRLPRRCDQVRSRPGRGPRYDSCVGLIGPAPRRCRSARACASAGRLTSFMSSDGIEKATCRPLLKSPYAGKAA